MGGTPYIKDGNDEKTLNPAARCGTCPCGTKRAPRRLHRDVETEPGEIEIQSGTAVQELHHHIYTRWYASPGFDWSRRSTSQAIIALVRRARSVGAGNGKCDGYVENSRQDVPRYLEAERKGNRGCSRYRFTGRENFENNR